MLYFTDLKNRAFGVLALPIYPANPGLAIWIARLTIHQIRSSIQPFKPVFQELVMRDPTYISSQADPGLAIWISIHLDLDRQADYPSDQIARLTIHQIRSPIQPSKLF